MEITVVQYRDGAPGLVKLSFDTTTAAFLGGAAGAGADALMGTGQPALFGFGGAASAALANELAKRYSKLWLKEDKPGFMSDLRSVYGELPNKQHAAEPEDIYAGDVRKWSMS